MALKQRGESSNLNYMRISGGKFYIGKDETTGYEELEGLVTDIRYKDEEYQGAAIRKFSITLQDGGEKYVVQVNTNSASYSSLISFLANVDLAQPIALHPKEDALKEGAKNTRKTILVSQNGKFAKSFFTKDNPNGLPPWNVVVVGKGVNAKKVIDNADTLEFLENYVNTKFIPVAKSNSGYTTTPSASVGVAPSVKATEAVTTDEEGVEQDVEGTFPWTT